MPTLQQKQEQEISLNQSQSQFACNICRRSASEPVLTRCGHLFWYFFILKFSWQCVHSHEVCTVCRFYIMEEDFIPIYTYEGSGNSSRNIPHKVKPKPKARHVGKIKNSASLGSSNEFSALYSTLNDNIQRQTLIAGNGYFPATVFTLLGQTDQQLQEIQTTNGKSVKRKITVLSWCLLFVVCFSVILSVRMDREER